MMNPRAYLDHNATTPLRPEARAAMAAAMDLCGNPSSVHAEGRAARALVERARAQVAAALGAEGAEVVFVSGATEAAALALAGRGLAAAAVEHEAVLAHVRPGLAADGDGRVRIADPAGSTLQLANSETGVIQDLPAGLAVSDLTQGFGKLPFAFNWLGIGIGFVSAHKLGGPKGVGALVMRRGTDLPVMLPGGGQEGGRRAGTENLIGIAGFGAAAAAAARDLAAGVWDRVAGLRDRLEARLCETLPDLVIAGRGAARLPNTSCLVMPGWKGETQVMVMDLAGFAVSAGSACSSGKLRPSRVLAAMGFDEEAARSALRVSIGPATTAAELDRFATAWTAAVRARRPGSLDIRAARGAA
jgi:cysteine desulfurase